LPSPDSKALLGAARLSATRPKNDGEKHLNRRTALAALALALVAGAVAAAPVKNPPIPKTPAFIQKAIDNPARAQAQRDRDANRKPGETLALAGLKPGDRVIEIASFGQYYTDILSAAVGPRGRIYMYDLPYTEARFGKQTQAFVDAHPNTEFKQAKYDEIDYPKNVDLVAVVLYYHDLTLNKVDPAVFNKEMFEALKPGGKLLIVDHKAADGSGRRDTPTLHRIETKLIVDEVTAAGFRLVADSDILANPQDDKTKRVFEPGLRGHTDQSVFVFQKPR
jgi:predicted methyltransferase